MSKTKIITISTILSLLVIGILIPYFLMLPAKNPKKLTVDVSSGDTLQDVAIKLEEQRIIKSNFLFEIYGKMKGYDRQLKPGKHAFEKPLTYNEIYSVLTEANGGQGITLTIPEGYNVEQIAEVLDSSNITNSKEFLNLVKTGEGLTHPVLDELPTNEGVKYRLEGFLFPNTYVFKENIEPEIVIYKMLDQFSASIKKMNRQDEFALELHEWVTLASLIEEEARVDEERSMIAGVIFNRLEDEMKLQIDATIQYALEEPKERLLFKDLEIESIYNTYIHKGLPPGPISNPGLASLQAAINPESHDFFYYVVKNDGTGEHFFSTTYDEHLEYIEKSRNES